MTYDFAVIGAGIAGASLSAQLAQTARVQLIEAETQPGYHSTGRSAAVYDPHYGPPQIRALTRAALAFFQSPPPGFADAPLLTPRPALTIARADQMDGLRAMAAETGGTLLDAQETQARFPLLRPGYASGGLWLTTCHDIDVHALLQGYLAQLRARGGHLVCKAPVTGLRRDAGQWTLHTPQSDHQARVIVNAAGAWADQIGAMAGATPIGLQPKRRSALTVDPPSGFAVDTLPMLDDLDQQFYVKPDAGRLLISPANADPMPPCDAQPDEMDIALAIDRVQSALNLPIRRIAGKWAGLRSFVADGEPVVGHDPQVPGLFWCAAQGGYGIQTAPALARLAAALILDQPRPADLMHHGVAPDQLALARLLP